MRAPSVLVFTLAAAIPHVMANHFPIPNQWDIASVNDGEYDCVEEPVGGPDAGWPYIGSTDLELCRDDWLGGPGHGELIVGIRIPSVNLDADELMNSPEMKLMMRHLGTPDDDNVASDDFDERSGWTQPIVVKIQAELSSKSKPFDEDVRYDVASRERTEAYVLWDIPCDESECNPFQAKTDELEFTPDLSPLVHEIVALGGWKKGNSMTFIFSRHSGNGWREFDSDNTYDEDFSGNEIRTPALFVKRPEECFCANWRNGIDTDMVNKQVCAFTEGDAHAGTRTVCQAKLDQSGNHAGKMEMSGGLCPSDMKLCTAKFSPPVYPKCTCTEYGPELVEAHIAPGARLCDKEAKGTCYEMHKTYNPKLGDAYSYYGCPVDMTPCSHMGPKYKLMEASTNVCSDGYERITTEEECATAGKRLGLMTTDHPDYKDGLYDTESEDVWPKGCYLWTDLNPNPSSYSYDYDLNPLIGAVWPDEVWFNYHETGSGNAGGKLICRNVEFS